MKCAGLLRNDFSAAPGVSVTFYTQGCPHRCKGCHNPETWDYEGGKEFTSEIFNEILESLTANGIKRNFCIMGGEPLSPENEFLTYLLVDFVKKELPETPIYIWTGYVYESLISQGRKRIDQILEKTDYLIDGPYIEELKDLTLKMRGSSNQRIINLLKN